MAMEYTILVLNVPLERYKEYSIRDTTAVSAILSPRTAEVDVRIVNQKLFISF